jgi:Na+/proline symporter
MGALVWAAARGVEAVVDTDAFAGTLLAVALPVVVGVASYAALAFALRVPELEHVARLVRGRLRKPS